MAKLLTISVAAYNVENYLDKLCQSLIASHMLDDLEILIVDDGSKDKTSEIAKKYQLLHPEAFVYIQKENGGHGSTINKGIELATGKYFKVLDGDDWFDSEGLRRLINELGKTNCDWVVSDYRRVFENTDREQIETVKGILPGVEYRIDEACQSMDRIRFHSVFIKTSILKNHNIHIDEHCFYVDNEILWFPFPYVNTVLYIDTVVYCYRLGLADQSVNVNVLAKRIDQHEFISKQVIQFYRNARIEMRGSKADYFDQAIADNIAWHIEALLLVPFSWSNYRRIEAYKKYANALAPEATQKIQSRACMVVMKHSVIGYPIAWICKSRIRKTR